MHHEHPVAAHAAADYAHISGARQLALSSEGQGWTGLTGQLFHYIQQRSGPIDVPPALDDVVTVHVAGFTDLEGKVGRRFPRHRATTGDIFVLPRGEPSSWNWTTACSIFCLYVEPALLARVAAEDSDLDPARVELIPRANARDPLLYHLGAALLGELRSPGPASRLYVDALTRTLAVHLLRTHTAFAASIADVEAGLTPAALRRAQEYIHDNLAQDLTLPEIAAAAGISPSYLARRFRRSTGYSVHQYVVTRRLDVARQLLLDGRHTVAEVATRTGFADQSHLNRHFKQRFGVTPGAVLDQSTDLQRESTNIQDKSTRSEVG